MNRLAILLTATGLVACAKERRTMKANDVGAAIGTRLRDAGLLVSLPTCPTVEVKKGTTFDCTFKIETMTYPIVGKVADVVDGKPQFEVEWKNGTNGVVQRNIVVPPLREELWKEFGASSDVSCHDPLILLDEKHSMTCDFTSHGLAAKINVTFDKRKHTGWTMTPTLLSRIQVQAAVMTEIKEKVGPTAEIKCGEKPIASEPVIVRPDDGKVICSLTANEKGKPTTGQVVINVGPDRTVTGWEMR